MNTDSKPFSEDILQAWVDNDLDDMTWHSVDDWLHNNPSEARRLHDYRLQIEQLQAVYGNIVDAPVPEKLRLENLRPSLKRSSAWRTGSLAATLLIGLIGGWVANSFYGPQKDISLASSVTGFTTQAIAAHQIYSAEVLHPVEVDVTQEKHLLAWLSKRLGQPVNAPGLEQFGYRLLGGRLLSDEIGPAAQFMYENAEGRRLTLYVVERPDGGNTAFRFQKRGGISAFYWIDGTLGYVLVGDVDRNELLQASTAVYQELSALNQ